MNKKQDTKDILTDIINSSKTKETRDLLADSKAILNQFNIQYEVYGTGQKLPNTPTIIVANHYIRPLLIRKNIFTTYESLFTSCIITILASKISKRPTAWVVKNDLAESIGPLKINIRNFQNNVIEIYNFIGAGEEYPFANKEKWLEALESGYNVACYPEAKVSTRLIQAKPGLTRIVKLLKENKINVNILPVAIYWHNGKYILATGNIIPTKGQMDDYETITMRRIAEMLPPKLRGYYR